MSKQIDKLIITSPYKEPGRHWLYNRERREFDIVERRRSAGYVTASSKTSGFDDPGIFEEIPLVNQIRPRVKTWREEGYPGVTGITKRLLNHWQGTEEQRARPFFFCQLEAIETLVWLTEAPAKSRVGIDIKGDGGAFERWCSKMATGSGKTVVMAMIIAWNFLNKVERPSDKRFSKNVLVVAPGLTIKSRLQVLQPSNPQNYYEAFEVVPSSLMDKLRQGRVLIQNWHALAWNTQKKIDAKIKSGKMYSVDRRERLEISPAAYIRNVLGEMAQAHNIIVINDEAHHAWRVNLETEEKGDSEFNDQEQATVWVEALDRIHQQTGILRCFDLSATPFRSSGKQAAKETLFSWIVSDFGLTDSIEAGLVKTPRVVVHDDGRLDKELKSRLYHIYMDDEVKDELNRSKVEASDSLPPLIYDAYRLLGEDWGKIKENWGRSGQETPPVMITVTNNTKTAERIEYAFEHRKMGGEELCSKEGILRIDSTILKKAEEADTALDVVGAAKSSGADGELMGRNQKERAEHLRHIVDTVGRPGEPGEKKRNIISVNMLSEGWDARTVTHIMGLRAFTSQLLCEQVVGRGLRRVSYETDDDGLFKAEYVNVFGVPFTFLPHEGSADSAVPRPVQPKTEIAPVKEKLRHKILFPNVIHIERQYRKKLSLCLEKLSVLKIDTRETITRAELQGIIEGKPNNRVRTLIGLDKIADTRKQELIFRSALATYDSLSHAEWKSNKETLFIQLVHLLEKFLASDKIEFLPARMDERERMIHAVLNQERIAQHISSAIELQSTERLEPVFDQEKPVLSTAAVRPWFTSKRCYPNEKSHINQSVCDSTWEGSAEWRLDNSEYVESFVKNDHLGFVVHYIYGDRNRKFLPDFIIRLSTGEYLVLEIKGRDKEQDRAKRKSLEWWVKAVNDDRRFGKWRWDVAFDPAEVDGILKEHATS